MAYVQKEVIDKARAALSVLNKKYGMKTSVAGLHDSTLSITISSGVIDFDWQIIKALGPGKHELGRFGINHYHPCDNVFCGRALEYLDAVVAIAMVDHWDKSDIQTDYFNCSFYVSVNIGKWNKPYICKN